VRARPRLLAHVAPCAVTLLLVGFPAHTTTVQAQSRDTTTEVSPPVKDLPLTAAQRHAFVGRYAGTLPFGEERSVRIVEENGVLKAHPDDAEANSPGARLLYQGDNVFRPEGVPGFAMVFVLEHGRATRIIICRRDGVMQAVRVP
jgi:hypothetical protein